MTTMTTTTATSGDLATQLDALGIRVGQPVLIADSRTSFDGHVGNVTRIQPAPADARSDVKAWVWVDGGPRYGILPQFLRPAVAA